MGHSLPPHEHGTGNTTSSCVYNLNNNLQIVESLLFLQNMLWARPNTLRMAITTIQNNPPRYLHCKQMTSIVTI